MTVLPRDAVTEASGRRYTRAVWWERKLPVIFVLPCVALLLGVGIFPLLYSLGVSFFDWTIQRRGVSFIGLQNYAAALGDARMWGALGHTLVFMVVAVALELVIGLGLAQTLIGHLPGKRVVLPLLLLPVVMAPIIVGYTWRMLWDTQYGPINQILGWIVGQPLDMVWLNNPRTVYAAIIVTEVWQWTPFMFLVLLAGLTAVNPDVREAAAIDGASAWHTFRHITLPLLLPVMILAILFRALDVFKLFDIVFALTNGGPGTLTETASLYVYTVGFKNFRLGYAAAISYILLAVVSIFISLLWRRLARTMED
jgi:multiple sugar transport system permease protein